MSVWGYLQEFWGAITDVVIGGVEYTIDFFQSIGNAVAGAIGGAFDWILHYLNDSFIFLSWILVGIKTLFSVFILPVSYIYNFAKGFVDYAIKTPTSITGSELNIYSTSTMAVFNTIPYWSTLTLIFGVAILVLGGVGIIKLFLTL